MQIRVELEKGNVREANPLEKDHEDLGDCLYCGTRKRGQVGGTFQPLEGEEGFNPTCEVEG